MRFVGGESSCRWSVAISFAALLLAWDSRARASLGSSEIEQVRHEVQTAQNMGHVRALVARPDLTSDEAAAVMVDALSATPLDAAHSAFLHELVFAPASTASRPILGVAVVRGLLGRADVLLSKHAKELNVDAASLTEVAQAYDLIEEIVVAGDQANITATARAECARALTQHIARNPSLLHPDEPVPWAVAHVRAQAAIALLDAAPDTVGRRVDVANALGLSGARRAVLIELGILVLDAGGLDTRLATLRRLLERLPGVRAGTTAIVISEKDRPRLRARGDAVVMVDAAPTASVTEASSPWGNEVAAPAIDEATLTLVRDLTSAVVRRAMDQRPKLRAAIDRDGGERIAAGIAGMLEIDADRTIEAAAARLLGGNRESVAGLSDAVGALAVFTAAPKGADGLVVAMGRAETDRDDGVAATHVLLDASGAAAGFYFNAHAWRIVRNDRGEVTGFLRDGAPVNSKMLRDVRPPAQQSTSWSGAGLIFARLAGTPRAAVMPGPRIWVYGSGVFDAIASPAPGDDVVVETDLRVNGGPAGVAVRVVPGRAGAFKGVSILVVPGSPPRAALLVGTGTGVETAATPVVELVSAPTQHLRIAMKGSKVEARIGSVILVATLPEGFEHGDVALRAYAGASVEASGWKVRRP